MRLVFTTLFISSFLTACSHSPRLLTASTMQRISPNPEETHFKSLHQVTQNGKSSHPQWLSSDHLIYEDASLCSQIFSLNLGNGDTNRLSNGRGLAIQPSVFPSINRMIFSSTSATQLNCQIPVSKPGILSWTLDQGLQLYASHLDGKDPLPLEPGAPRSYHSDARGCHLKDENFIVFVSSRNQELQLYRASLDSFRVFAKTQPLTTDTGYKGQISFSPDCTQMIWVASHPKTPKEIKKFNDLLQKNLVQPTETEIWISYSDGTHPKQLTQNRAIYLSPTFSPDGKSIVFASNLGQPKKNQFHLYRLSLDGKNLEQISFSDGSEFSPAFSLDGKYLAFSSNRNSQPKNNENSDSNTDLFVAEWN